MMYLILSKCHDSIGRAYDGYEPHFTEDRLVVHKALMDEKRQAVVYRMDNLTRIEAMNIDFDERETR